MSLVHERKPSRRQAEPREPYGAYRDELREDFNQSCGYCDDSDHRMDRICFHIDHFAPKKKFPALENTYSNLVYACRFCNIPKSNHWIGDDPAIHNDGEKGFVDPCSDAYVEHIGREATGKIVGKTPLGCYIVKRLNLGLLRHQLLWRARRARLLREEISPLIEEFKARGFPKGELYIALLEKFRELTIKIEEYEFGAQGG